jgi:chloramphenicol-sensitive protein RarD
MRTKYSQGNHFSLKFSTITGLVEDAKNPPGLSWIKIDRIHPPSRNLPVICQQPANISEVGYMTSMSKGVLFGIGAYTLWGLLPLYWRALESVAPLEILGNRMVWSLVFVAGVLALRKNWGWLRASLRRPRLLRNYVLAALLLSANWLIYIWAVNSGYVVETSLGYFINPLLNVLLGTVFLGEKLRVWQALAVGLAGVGVLYLTLNYGGLPWIALSLALSFGLYGFITKTSPLSATQGLALEMSVVFLPAMAYLAYLGISKTGSLTQGSSAIILLLVLAGAVTAIPLLMFGAAARRIPLSTVGFLQYIAPTLQFLLGVFWFREPFPPQRLVGFSLIWVALLVYSLEGLWSNHKRASLQTDFDSSEPTN